MRPVQNVFQKLSCTEQRRDGVVAYLWLEIFISNHGSDHRVKEEWKQVVISSHGIKGEVSSFCSKQSRQAFTLIPKYSGCAGRFQSIVCVKRRWLLQRPLVRPNSWT